MTCIGETFYHITDGLHDILKKPGYIPFVGTVVGAARIVLATASVAFSALAALASLLCMDFENAKYFAAAIVLNVIYAARGAVEMVPFVGGAVCFTADLVLGCVNIALSTLLLPVKVLTEETGSQ